ncbi:hypothetical protein PF008_g26874 [Phytophthora fragariae]|uniref:Uncharacterized protein n=1 Tax=Phytophthora fragariae TaxID=53985 RepID=A0A6G0QFS7_9STRA|nr:hypothetical protein PF008_g26874 [Phytophthora fragariae]
MACAQTRSAAQRIVRSAAFRGLLHTELGHSLQFAAELAVKKKQEEPMSTPGMRRDWGPDSPATDRVWAQAIYAVIERRLTLRQAAQPEQQQQHPSHGPSNRELSPELNDEIVTVLREQFLQQQQYDDYKSSETAATTDSRAGHC